ncbi:hypothetical protein BDR04DRAFT_1027268, partial [Suillus decipiens]
YRELMRVAQQWRQLKTMKWHGFGHRFDDPKAGDLALFCLACPQPGINMSMSGDDSFDDWKYTQSFVMDRNFKAKHLHPIKPHDEVWLSDGLRFMVGKDRYKLHLAEASDTVEKLSCNNHWAVNQANVVHHKLESMGIMADDLIPLEMLLYEGQANDALHNLRIHLCNKAILFRTTVRQAKSQALKT